MRDAEFPISRPQTSSILPAFDGYCLILALVAWEC